MPVKFSEPAIDKPANCAIDSWFVIGWTSQDSMRFHVVPRDSRVLPRFFYDLLTSRWRIVELLEQLAYLWPRGRAGVPPPVRRHGSWFKFLGSGPVLGSNV